MGGPCNVAQVEHDGDGKGVVPSGLEPTGVIVGPEEVQLYAAQLVTPRGEGVEEASGLGADGNGHLIAGDDGGDGFLRGDQVILVMLSPVHRRSEVSEQCYHSDSTPAGPVIQL